MMKIYDIVRKTALPNYVQARVPIPSGLNITVWKDYFQHSEKHKPLLDYLEYGFPLNYLGINPPDTETLNHSSATNYPSHVELHIKTEKDHNAMMGPFTVPPFQPWSHTNPLMSRQKKGTHQRRIITDMSWPVGRCVNASIPEDSYQGQPTKTKLPTLHDILAKVRQYGRGAYLASLDISRAYSQLRVDPIDWPLQGLYWNNQYYISTSLQFGSRWGANSCQITQEAVCHIMQQEDIDCKVYIDDYIFF
jgi:hypothetical protein